MPRDQAPIDPDLLLSQTGWVRTLSRSLVRDPLGAEDVAQETLLAALVSPPRYAENVQQLRAWLGRVAFNLAHRATRRDLRQRAREARVARSESLESTAEHVARSSEIQQVAEAVARLEEPYRTAVVLFYFNRLSTAEIAERTGTTDNAVRKRLWRARGRLRHLLDPDVDGRPVAVPALLPLGAWLRRAQQVAGRAFFGKGAALAAAAAALVLAARLAPSGRRAAAPTAPGVLARFAPSGTPALAMRVPLAPGEARLAPSGRSLGTPALGVDPRRPERPSPPPAPAAGDGASRAALGGGRVVDLGGSGLQGMSIVLASEPARVLATSDGMGGFELPSDATADPAGTLLARAPGWTTVRGARLDRGADGLLVVAAPGADVRGVVRDPLGAPLSGVELGIALDPQLFLALDEPLDLTRRVPREARSEADGRFALGESVVGPGVRLVARLDGYSPCELPLAAAPSGALVVTLRPLPAGELAAGPRLRGFVLDELDQPIALARVRLGRRVALSGTDGAFALPTAELDPGADLVIEKVGFRPRRIAGLGGRLVAGVPPVPLRVHLGSGLRAIDGRLVDRDGAPARGWTVAVQGTGERQLCALAPTLASESTGVTDEGGRFRLGGLASRDYRVVARGPGGASLSSAPVPAGTGGLELRVAGHELARVEPSQAPAGAAASPEPGFAGVALARSSVLPVRLPAGPASWMAAATGAPAQGRLQAASEGLGRHGMTTTGDPGAGMPGWAFSTDEAFLKVVAGPTDPGVRLRLSHADGADGPARPEAVPLDDGLDGPQEEIELVDGQSLVLRVPAGDYVASFRIGETELARVPVALGPGALVRLRP